MKKQTIKSILAFLILNAIFLISAKGQIVYTDVVPDITISCSNNCISFYNLDLNNDSVTDFNLYASHTHQQFINKFSIGATVQNNNAIKIYNTFPIPFSNSEIIDGTINPGEIWHTNITVGNILKSGNLGQITGLWSNTTDGFLGLRLEVAGQIYYGWARLRLNWSSTFASFTIKDYAYNSTPKQPILAGQNTTTGITENNSSNHFSIYSFDKTLNIELNNATPLNGNITVCNTLGQELKNIKIENREMQIDMNDCNSGIYFVTVQTNEAIETKKIYLE